MTYIACILDGDNDFDKVAQALGGSLREFGDVLLGEGPLLVSGHVELRRIEGRPPVVDEVIPAVAEDVRVFVDQLVHDGKDTVLLQYGGLAGRNRRSN